MKLIENGINIKNLDCEIYRIFPLHRFKDLFITKKNGLVRPKLWEDPFENFFLKSTAICNGEQVSLEQLRHEWYGQCWTKNRDSDAMWRIYSKFSNNDKCDCEVGVRVGTTISKLFSDFYDCSDKFAALKFFIGEVHYKSKVDIEHFLMNNSFTSLTSGGQPQSIAETLCIKRREFEHENEVRLLFADTEKQYSDKNFINFAFDVGIINDIALDPRLPLERFEKIKLDLTNIGFNFVPIEQSDLYKIGSYTIQL